MSVLVGTTLQPSRQQDIQIYSLLYQLQLCPFRQSKARQNLFLYDTEVKKPIKTHEAQAEMPLLRWNNTHVWTPLRLNSALDLFHGLHTSFCFLKLHYIRQLFANFVFECFGAEPVVYCVFLGIFLFFFTESLLQVQRNQWEGLKMAKLWTVLLELTTKLGGQDEERHSDEDSLFVYSWESPLPFPLSNCFHNAIAYIVK